jgi:lipid II:glycine glycyltransferase (peptidoglycan interpeptide bridge formation enzyme)
MTEPGGHAALPEPSQQARVIECDPLVDERWDRFVSGRPGARVYQLGAWARILHGAYGYEPRYLAVEVDGQLTAVLPLMLTRGVLHGRRLRSLPVVSSAGPLAATPEHERLLLTRAQALADELRVRLLQVRSRAGLEHADLLEEIPKMPSWVVDLTSVPEFDLAKWNKRRSLTSRVKQAEKAGVSVREGGSEELRRFYGFYLQVMRSHHALPRPYRQFELSLACLGPEHCKLFVAEHRGRMIAATLCHPFGDSLDVPYTASDYQALELRPNHVLWWHVLRWAQEQGFAYADLGDASPTGKLVEFKKQFLAEPVADHRYDYTTEAAGRPDSMRDAVAALDRGNEAKSRKQRLVTAVWDRTPLTLTRAAGTAVHRYA